MRTIDGLVMMSICIYHMGSLMDHKMRNLAIVCSDLAYIACKFPSREADWRGLLQVGYLPSPEEVLIL